MSLPHVTPEPRIHAHVVRPARAEKAPGRLLAVVSSVMLAAQCALLVVLGSGIIAFVREGYSLGELFAFGGLSLAFYAVWGLGVFATIAAFAAIALFGFRERWFWRTLVAAACIWLLFPPVFAVIGLVSLFVLVRSRRDFPIAAGDAAAR